MRAEVLELRREFYYAPGRLAANATGAASAAAVHAGFIRLLFTDFSELHGDRAFGDDPAMVAGFARFHGRPVLVVGHQKGRDTKQRAGPQFRPGQARRLPQGAAR